MVFLEMLFKINKLRKFFSSKDVAKTCRMLQNACMASKVPLVQSKLFVATDLIFFVVLMTACTYVVSNFFDALGLGAGADGMGTPSIADLVDLVLLVATKFGVSVALAVGVFCFFKSYLHDERIGSHVISAVWSVVRTRFISAHSRPLDSQFRPPRSIS